MNVFLSISPSEQRKFMEMHKDEARMKKTRFRKITLNITKNELHAYCLDISNGVGQTRVYKLVDLRKCDGYYFAVKVHARDSPELQEAVRLQVYCMDHPNISKLRWVSGLRDSEELVAVTSTCYDTDLEKIIFAQKTRYHTGFDENVVRRAARMLLGAFRHMHSLSVVHNNVCPSHVFYDEERGILVIGNFDKAYDPSGSSFRIQGDSNKRRRMSGASARPPACNWAHMAPEQLNGRGNDANADLAAKTDMWGLGCVLVEMLTGERLYAGTTRLEVMSNHTNGPFRTTMNNLKITPPARSFLYGLLYRDPTKRLSSDAAYNHAWLRTTPVNRYDVKKVDTLHDTLHDGFAKLPPLTGGSTSVANVLRLQSLVVERAAEMDNLFENVYGDVRRRALERETQLAIRVEGLRESREEEARMHDKELDKFRDEEDLCITLHGFP